MKKIISLFQRNYDGDRLVRNEIVPGAEWVIAGEGIPTRKLDGTCCMIREGKLYKRYEIKVGGKAPTNFEPASEVDENTGKQQGWLSVGDGPEDKWHREALAAISPEALAKIELATFELLGPKIQGNPEGYERHTLVNHRDREVLRLVPEPPRDFDGIKAYLAELPLSIEGIVWHHEDGRMVKIKAKDFGIKRGKK